MVSLDQTTILLSFPCCRVTYCIEFFHHGVDAILIVRVSVGLVISCAGAYWLAMSFFMLFSWVFLSLLEDFFMFTEINGRSGVGNVFSVATLEGLALVSGIFLFVVSPLEVLNLGLLIS